MKLFSISEITLIHWRKFQGIKRAWYSFIILTTLWLLSLFSNFIAGSKPILLVYENQTYFPVIHFYSGETFGKTLKTELDYKELVKEWKQRDIEHFALFPIIPHDPLHSYLDYPERPPHPPSSTHLLGTDRNARDILSRLVHGFRIAMSFSLLLLVISLVSAIIIGGVQGYFGGKIDLSFQRLTEIWSTLPFLYVVILIGSIYGRSFTILVFVMSLFNWIGISYYMRAEFLKIKNLTYVKAAKTLGLSPTFIFLKEILPNALTPVITFMPFILISGIGSLTALDFLGFGLQPPTPSWGALLSDGLQVLYAPWVAISAVAALFFTLLLSAFIGEGPRDAFDPKSSSGRN